MTDGPVGGFVSLSLSLIDSSFIVSKKDEEGRRRGINTYMYIYKNLLCVYQKFFPPTTTILILTVCLIGLSGRRKRDSSSSFSASSAVGGCDDDDDDDDRAPLPQTDTSSLRRFSSPSN